MANVSWSLKSVDYGNCNCAYGCPCQFNAPPTHGNCQYVIFSQIKEGHYEEINLDGLIFVILADFPEAIHKGNGTQQLIIDKRATEDQREAIRRIAYNEDTEELLTPFAIFTAMSTTVLDPVIAPIELEVDIEARTARGGVPGLVVSNAEPIRNPVTGKEHRATIGLPNGFGFMVAEMGSGSSKTNGEICLEFANSYAQFTETHMTDRGLVR